MSVPGKCLAVTGTEVMVKLKCPPLAVFDEISPATSNYFRFRLSHEVVVLADVWVKPPGEQMRGEPVELIARPEPRSERLPCYRLLHDVLRGDPSLFTRDDSVEAAYPILDSARADAAPVNKYAPGTWAPPTAARIVSSAEGWHYPKREETAPC